MASYGNRSKPALYKPTDFNSQQKKAQMRAEQKENKSSSSEGGKTPGEKPENNQNDGMKKVTILKPPQNKSTSDNTPLAAASNTKSETSENSQPTGKPVEKSQSKKPASKPEEMPQGVSDKDAERIQKLREFMEKQQISNAASQPNSKPVKGKEGANKTEMSQKKGQEKKDPKDTRTTGNRNQRNNRSKGKPWSDNPPKKVSSVSANKSNQSTSKKEQQSQQIKPQKETQQQQQADGKAKEKPKEKQKDKPTSNQQQNQLSSNGVKPKQGATKSEGTADKTASQRTVNQHVKKVSNYQQRNYSNQRPPQHNATSILGNPYQHHPQVNIPPPVKPQSLVYPGPGLAPGPSVVGKSQKPHITVPASKDKHEHKRSLDFVKSFFDNDPEVQYHRQKNAEKAASAVSTNIVATQQQHVAFPTSSVTQSMPAVSSFLSTENEIASYLSNHHHSTHGTQNPTASLMPQNIPLPSNYSNFASFYHQQHQQSPHTQMTAHGAHSGSSSAFSQGSSSSLQPQQQQIHQQHRSSPGPFHAIGHGSMAQTHQHQQRNFDLYSSMNQNTLHHSHSQPNMSGAHFPIRSHATSHSSTVPSNNYNMLNSYSNYFPSGSPHSHVFHAQQEIDPSVMSTILDEVKKPKKWQQKALTKCGPINSQQAQSLIKELICGTYECMVCCDSIKVNNAVWSCGSCYHIFHLHCIRKWAKSEAASVKGQNGWRCPGCQSISTRPPNKYFCFCGKSRDPDWTPRDGITPHSCGEICKKKRKTPPCDHNCNELCHPGPCPSCPVMVTKSCFCTKTSTKVRCGANNPLTCDNICSKVLECGQHHCDNKCHKGPCKKCEERLPQECFCGREKRIVVCGSGDIVEESVEQEDEKENEDKIAQKTFSCQQPCGRILSCGNHLCEDSCHIGECRDCPLSADNVQTCPCKKVSIAELLGEQKRSSCLDPVPTCDNFCGKKLPCGRLGSSHLCLMKCHEGPCKPCNKTMEIKCRCTGTKKEMACKDMKPDEPLLCDRKCTKKRKCGRHKCNQKCCTDKEHNCNIICGKKLSCGQHKCEEVCHAGFCPTCWRAGFDDLSCHCGATVVYPPIPCGAKPPECNQPCARSHPCGHPPSHPCHSDVKCPPCTSLTTKTCMGGHEVWKNVPCHQEEVSCGRKCGKPLKCSMHNCNKTCHKGLCLGDEESCQQPCILPRPDCSHPCNAPCHVGFKCPDNTCKFPITITCRCRRKSANALCMAGNLQTAYQSFNAEILNMQLQNLQTGQSIDISSLTNPEKRPKFLDCDEDCSRLERNKRFVEAMGIESSENGHFKCVIYSDALKQEARLRLPFILNIEIIFEKLYAALMKSGQQQLIHHFPPMNSNQRKIVHELAECYGFKSYSIDQEPKRSTVIIAYKESYVPQIKLSQLIENEVKNLIPSSLNRRNITEPQLGVEKKALKSILKQPAQQQPIMKHVNYFEDDFQE